MSQTTNTFNQLIYKLLSKPKAVVAFWFLLSVVFAIGLLFVSVTSDYRVFFSEDNPQLQDLEEQEALFDKADNLIVGFKGDIYAPKSLELIRWVSSEMKKLKFVQRVDSITDVNLVSYVEASASTFEADEFELSDEDVADFDEEDEIDTSAEDLGFEEDDASLDASASSSDDDELDFEAEIAMAGFEISSGAMEVLPPLPKDQMVVSQADADAVKRTIERQPSLVGRLISKKGDATIVAGIFQMPGEDLSSEIPLVMDRAREIYAEVERRIAANNLDLSPTFFGMLPFNQTLAETAFGDLTVLFPVSIALMMLTLLVLLHGLRPAFITGMVILSSVVVAVGATCWLRIPLNTVTAVAPLIILTLAIAHSVHLFVNFRQDMMAGGDTQSGLRHTLAMNIQPVTLTSITTIIGFLTLNFSDAPPFRELGNIVAVGVLVSWISALTLLPALVQILGPGGRVVESERHEHMDRFGEWVVNNRGKLRVLALAALVLIAMIPRNQINDVFRVWFGEDDIVRQGMEFSLDELGGLEQLMLVVDAGEKDGIFKPAFFTEVEKMQLWLMRQPEVAHVQDYTHLLKQLNRAFNDGDQAYHRLPATESDARNHIDFLGFGQSKGNSLNNIIDNARRKTLVTVTMARVNSSELKAFEARVRDWTANNLKAVQATHGSGVSLIFAELGQRNVRQMLLGTVVGLILISIILIVALRSIKIGLVSMVPNLVPAALGFGLWALVSGEVNMAIATVMGMTMGIVVDDTIHFLSKYMRARRDKGLDAVAAVKYCFHEVGQALWVTTVVLVGGFLVMTFSPFQPTADIGLMTAIVISFALAADFLLLPQLLIAVDSAPEENK